MYNQITILVPGIGGSKIYCRCENPPKRLYPRKKWFFNSAINDHMYTCTNRQTKIMKTFWFISIYEKFLKRFLNNPLHKVKSFSYYWLDSPIDVAGALVRFLKLCNVQKYDHINLVGHSLGGLIIRIMIEYLTGLQELSIDNTKITVYQCGTPMYGSKYLKDYNYGFELAAILASNGVFYSSCPTQKSTKRELKKIKPMLFSIGDLRTIFEKYYVNLLYLLPTPMILALQTLITTNQVKMKSPESFQDVFNVHKCLATLSFPTKYVFFFNICFRKIEHIFIPFHTSDMFSQVTIHDIRPGRPSLTCGIYLDRLLKSDGLVVPYSNKHIPMNCSVYVDESRKYSHAYLLNSLELWNIIQKSHNNYEYYQNISNQPPEYDDLFYI